MSPNSKREYLKKIRARYLIATRKEKRAILDEFCQVCGYHRKYAIALLLRGVKANKKRSGPVPIYAHNSVTGTLKYLWVKSGYLCSKRLKAAMPLWLPWYQQTSGLAQEYVDKLLGMSPSTMDRYLKQIKAKVKIKGKSLTKPGKLLKQHIPIETAKWDTTQPGFLEADTVAHYRKRKIVFTRSRPYKKEDNAHVEQKNWTKVRHLFGYQRLDKPEFVVLMNDIYKNEWRLLQNFFSPSVKLMTKTRFGAKIKKEHDKPKTPYQRILESEAISQAMKAELTRLFKTLNPFMLKASLEEKLNAILKRS
ncbi:integrase [Candidatus Saganbacteria bacterium]|nr:integrase [Candidatus Saganbacteria bacterium]